MADSHINILNCDSEQQTLLIKFMDHCYILVFMFQLKLQQSLIMKMKRSDDLMRYFKYELTSEPISLFKDQMMRKDSKASLLPSLVQPTYQHDDKDEKVFPI